jgi:hypothetical protein
VRSSFVSFRGSPAPQLFSIKLIFLALFADHYHLDELWVRDLERENVSQRRAVFYGTQKRVRVEKAKAFGQRKLSLLELR